ncbi:MAG: secretin N-terminal domain-containing protein [Planctomycetota bacterium]|jgi:TPR repeat protein
MKTQNDPKFRTIITILTCIVFCMVVLPPNAIAQQTAQQPIDVTDEKTPQNDQQELLFSLSIDDAEIKDVLDALAYQAQFSLVLPEEVTGRVSLRLKDVTWQTAFAAVLQAGGYSAIKTDDVLFITTAKEKEEPVIIDEPLSLEGFDLNFAKAKNLKDTVTKLLSGRGKMGINERLNSIVVTDTQENLDLISQAIQKLDIRAPQVMIEALIVNVKLTDEFKMGVDWTKLGTSDNFLSQDLSATTGSNPFGQISFSKISGNWSFIGLVDFIQTHDNVRILASPKVLVLNNHTATIDAVEEIPYQELTQTSAGGNIGSTSFKQAGIKLQVTPQITDDGHIIMHVKPEQSAQTGTFTLGQSDVPVIETRKTETTMRVKNGQTIIIGGLRKKRPTVREDKLPILGDLPLLGVLFRKLDKEQVESELGIFITPHIYTDGKLSADELDLLNATNTEDTLIDLLDLLRLGPDEKAAEQEYAEAQYNLGVMYSNGQGVEQDYKEAVKWYRKAAEQEYAEAQYDLGVMYDNGQGVEQDYKEAVKWYRKAAEQGHAEAQYNLGVMYDNGQGVEQDYKEAVKWYRKAAEQEYASAQYNLGTMYDNGQGVEQDYKEAVKWYHKAAEQGVAFAQYNLGNMYSFGRGVEQDYQEAVKWYHKAAEQGVASAQYNLGFMYSNSQGVEQDYQEAVKWYHKAAEQGYAKAQHNLGIMYSNGQGVEHDYQEAVEWYHKAAEQGDASAQYNLGLMHYKGQGVIEDYVEAYKWLLLAGMNGEDVSKLKELFKSEISPGQIAEAQQLAKTFVPKEKSEKRVQAANRPDDLM